jgi:hypothetical protein
MAMPVKATLDFAGGGATVTGLPAPSAASDAVNKAYADAKQDALVSGVNIKTVNGTSLLGSGDLVISGGGGGASPILSWAI